MAEALVWLNWDICNECRPILDRWINKHRLEEGYAKLKEIKEQKYDTLEEYVEGQRCTLLQEWVKEGKNTILEELGQKRYTISEIQTLVEETCNELKMMIEEVKRQVPSSFSVFYFNYRRNCMRELRKQINDALIESGCKDDCNVTIYAVCAGIDIDGELSYVDYGRVIQKP